VTPSTDPTERFTALIGLPARDVPLDLAALLLAAHDHPVDIDGEVGNVDRLAEAVASVGATDAETIAAALFGDGAAGGAFTGNRADYGDPRNSYLDEVLRRRLGIPITLSLLLIEVGRRLDVALEGVGMPGHFLVGAGSGTYVDPFHGGLVLDTDGCRALFEELRPGVAFDARYLEPVDSHAIVARMLANLVNTLVARAPTEAAWAVRLRCAVPGVSAAERRDAAALLGSLGFFAEAAEALEAVAPALDDEAAARAEREAVALRARSN
jgi:regulator of sirC expression with transglutaminase-like and TPR domain